MNRRTRRITFLANETDAKRIEAAAADARMSVSTYCLVAALDKSCDVCSHIWENASTGEGDDIRSRSICRICGKVESDE